jgi:hypothetical protein
MVLAATKIQWLIGDKINKSLEPITRKMCYALHKRRTSLVVAGETHEIKKTEEEETRKAFKKRLSLGE